MGNRSFCVLSSEDFRSPNYQDYALRALTENHVLQHSLEGTQVFAWKEELKLLADLAAIYPDSVFALEYMIPRMGKRVDAVALIQNRVFIVEFKVGKDSFQGADEDQVLDYAFDLKNFHRESHSVDLYPILCCTEARQVSALEGLSIDGGVNTVIRTNAASLKDAIASVIQLSDCAELDYQAWLDGLYQPTPTIVEAAQALYESNEVEDISRNEAGLTNILLTTSCIERIVSESKANRKKSICFVTGVPGAGKTLVGLNLASKRRDEGAGATDETAVFLSGNGPLIEVLQESLVRDQQKRDKDACDMCSRKRSNACKGECSHHRTIAEIKAEVKTFIQGVHLFREEFFLTDSAPHEHVAIFDEAQRAWTKEQLYNKMKTRRQNKRIVEKSEPECLIEYMDRHDDWAVMICLVGGGQEIHQGEAGIVEWFKALDTKFPEWSVFASPEIATEHYMGNADLNRFATRLRFCDELHLAVDMRSFRNQAVSAFAEAVVENRPDTARHLYSQVVDTYPIVLTRDLAKAKEWVREKTKRPSDRYGIVADSYGQRIRGDGVIVPMDFDAPTWFLDGRDNIDSSYFMEVAASEFKIQGLEIDYAVVAWEGDYRYKNGEFTYNRFYGNQWQKVNAEMPRRYLKNGYRVLLTRARQGYVIYVPKGSSSDPTRPTEHYDETYEYLKGIGIKEV